jgi:outer membrane receptor protein involved in Fe transport
LINNETTNTASIFVLQPMMIRTVLLILAIPLLSLSLIGQVRTTSVISGKIVDATTLEPIEYANVVLMDTATHTMVTGVVSDSNGFFRMKDIRAGHYYVEYSFIGYNKQRTKVISAGKKKTAIDLGELKLSSSAVTMEEVNITAEKSMMIQKIDRKVFNVQKDIMAQTGTAIDMLQIIPSVTVDVDGNISLRGSQTVTVLINGRPSVMAGTANLDQMPASLIERIEVITNPSAKYRPDGTGGIINIILKKERKAGFNGVVGANAGNHDRYNTNLQLNYNSGKVNLFGSYGFRQDYRIRSGRLNSQTIDTVTNQSVYLEQSSEGTVKPLSHMVQLGIDLNLGKKDIAGISGTYNYRQVKRYDVTSNLYKDNELQPSESYTRTLNGKETEKSAGMKAFYEHTFDREQEHQLKIDFEYQDDDEKEDDYWTNVYQFPAYPEGNDHTLGDNKQQEINFSLNYNRPLRKDMTLETGYESNTSLLDQQQDVFHMDSTDWVPDPGSANLFYGNQSVFALYGLVSYTYKKLSVLGGLRAEEALVGLEFRTIDTTAYTSYFALYPTLHLGISSGDNEWQLNYSRRVNRPDVDDMNPVPEYRDPRNIFKGNPDLKPEDIHSFELGYSYHPQNLTLIPTLFYRYKVNGFAWVTSSLNDTVLVSTLENLSTDQSAGIDFSGSWQIAKVATVNFSGSGYYNTIDASNIGYSSSKGAFSWNAKINASVNITKTTLFQVNAQYRSKALTAQGYRMPAWGVNLGFRQDFFKKRLSFIATVSDLFDSQVWKSEVNTPILVQQSSRRRDARVIYCGLVYNFGTNGKKSKEPKFEFDTGGEGR